mmetsp:Transcript_24573/g.52956  ORF Transcript_24573/g.52956 Transcript_24573/m.52956 type:complete len:85 (+) Transcript_24573:738-992(+)
MNGTLFHPILRLVLSVSGDICLDLAFEMADVDRSSVDCALTSYGHFKEGNTPEFFEFMRTEESFLFESFARSLNNGYNRELCFD